MASYSETDEDVRHDGGRPRTFSPFVRHAAAVTGIVIAIVLVLLFLWAIMPVLLLLFAGILLSIFLSGLARLVSRLTHLSRGWALLVTGLGLIGLFVLLGMWIAPQVNQQVSGITETIPQSIEELKAQIREYPWGEYVLSQVENGQGIPGGGGSGTLSRISGALTTALGLVFDFIFFLMIGVYLAVNPKLYRKGIVGLVPVRKRERADQVLRTVGNSLWRWLRGQFIAMAIVGALTGVGLAILGMPLALGLGLVAALFEFVPILGPWAAGFIAVLVAFTEGGNMALYVAFLFLGIQQIESNIITPLVMKEAVQLPPVLTLAAAIIAGLLFGLPGIILATPLAVAVTVLIQKIYVEDVLGDPVPALGEERKE